MPWGSDDRALDDRGFDDRRARGVAGEALAAAWYEAAGYDVLDRNWRCRDGELDLVCRLGGTVVFCEVKARRTAAYGTPADAVTAAEAPAGAPVGGAVAGGPSRPLCAGPVRRRRGDRRRDRGHHRRVLTDPNVRSGARGLTEAEGTAVETLTVERREGVVTVTMNRPERKNAINATMRQELVDVLVDVASRADDRVLVVGRRGRGVLAPEPTSATWPGLTQDPEDPPLVAMRRLGDAALALHRLAKPTIAKVDGVAVGAGLGLALGCDLVVASERARFSAIFSPPRSVARLRYVVAAAPARSALARAKELALFGDIIDASRAVRPRPRQPGRPGRRARPVRRRLGRPPGGRTAIGAVDDEDAAQRVDVVVDVGSAGRTRPDARPSISAPGTRWRRWPRSPRSGSPGSPAAEPVPPALIGRYCRSKTTVQAV